MAVTRARPARPAAAHRQQPATEEAGSDARPPHDVPAEDDLDSTEEDEAATRTPAKPKEPVLPASSDDSDDDEQQGSGQGQRTQQRRRQAAAPGAVAEVKKRSRKATAAEKRAIPYFVSSVLTVTRDASVKLRALGKKATNDELGRKNQSLLGVYEFLATADDTPPGAMQGAIASVPGAQVKKLGGYNVWRMFKVTEDLEQLRKLIASPEMRAVLKPEHVEALEKGREEERMLSQALAARLTALRKECSGEEPGRTAAANERRRTATPPEAEREPAAAAAAAAACGGAHEEHACADTDDEDEPASPPPYPPSLSHSSALLCTTPRHSERTYASYRAIAQARDGPFRSPTGTGETKRRAMEVLATAHRCLREHQRDHPEDPSFDYDSMRAMELAGKYPKLAKSVHAEMVAELFARSAQEGEEEVVLDL